MKKTLKYALHYDEIVSFVFKEDDFITIRIINYYQEYLLGVIKCNNYRIRVLDKTIYEYLTNVKFNKYVTDFLEALENSNDGIDYYNNVDINLPRLYRSFQKDSLEVISSTRWL